MRRNQIIAPRGDKWIVKCEGNERAACVVATQKEVIAIAKPFVKA